jgi:hypothetical protein
MTTETLPRQYGDAGRHLLQGDSAVFGHNLDGADDVVVELIEILARPVLLAQWDATTSPRPECRPPVHDQRLARPSQAGNNARDSAHLSLLVLALPAREVQEDVPGILGRLAGTRNAASERFDASKLPLTNITRSGSSTISTSV